MKNKILIIILIISIIIIATVIGFYFIKQNKPPANSIENTESLGKTDNDGQINSNHLQNKLVTDDFEITLPVGWQKTEPTIGSSAMAVKIDEQLSDPAAQKINFRSYFAVVYDTMQEKSLEEYIQTTKDQLEQTISNIIFSQEHDATINSQAARAFEADFNQKGIDFKILMVVIKGTNDDVWIISFNTLQSTWTEYKDSFSDIANSFSLKK
ncbi:MAG: hypothetical protein PHV47_02435 [Candidatus Pacebacteria bacterium]|nr:hypothetical protein [Candidatus Paceibacterota bacterium]MDD5621001.1 hypothetical protein [Candidatus Paceibacterota bacterium]